MEIWYRGIDFYLEEVILGKGGVDNTYYPSIAR